MKNDVAGGRLAPAPAPVNNGAGAFVPPFSVSLSHDPTAKRRPLRSPAEGRRPDSARGASACGPRPLGRNPVPMGSTARRPAAFPVTPLRGEGSGQGSRGGFAGGRGRGGVRRCERHRREQGRGRGLGSTGGYPARLSPMSCPFGRRAVPSLSNGPGFVQHSSRELDKQRDLAGGKRDGKTGARAEDEEGPPGRGGPFTFRAPSGADFPALWAGSAGLAGGPACPTACPPPRTPGSRIHEVPPSRTGWLASLLDGPSSFPPGSAQSRTLFPSAPTAYHLAPKPSTSCPLTSPASVSLAK